MIWTFDFHPIQNKMNIYDHDLDNECPVTHIKPLSNKNCFSHFIPAWNSFSTKILQQLYRVQHPWCPICQERVSDFWLVCDSLSDIIFVLDVVVQLRTGYLEQGLMVRTFWWILNQFQHVSSRIILSQVYDSKKLASHYLHARAFIFDLISLIPLDILQFRFGTQPLLRFPRFFKVSDAEWGDDCVETEKSIEKGWNSKISNFHPRRFIEQLNIITLWKVGRFGRIFGEL